MINLSKSFNFNMIPSAVNIYLKKTNAKKIRGKKAPIIFQKKPLKISSIYKLTNIPNRKIPIGYEILLFEIKQNQKSEDAEDSITSKKSFISKESNVFLGKVIARVSSDFIALFAKKLINKLKLIDLNLLQYPLYEEEKSKKLILITKISNDSNRNIEKDENTVEEAIDRLETFYKTFRKKMIDLIELIIKGDI